MTTQLQQCREVAAALDEEVTEWRRKDAEWREHRNAAEKALRDMPFVMDNYRAALARAEAAEAEAAEARATNEALAELAASETERRVALAERVAELEAALASADDETASASAQAARFWRTNNKLAERVAELEAALGELDALAPDYELPNGAAVAEAIASGYILTAGCRDIHGKVAGVAAVERNNEMLRARVAELEAQLAAQQWRPVTEEPTVDDSYLVYRAAPPTAAPWHYDFAVWDNGHGWETKGFTHWQPLPAAPQENQQ